MNTERFWITMTTLALTASLGCRSNSTDGSVGAQASAYEDDCTTHPPVDPTPDDNAGPPVDDPHCVIKWECNDVRCTYAGTVYGAAAGEGTECTLAVPDNMAIEAANAVYGEVDVAANSQAGIPVDEGACANGGVIASSAYVALRNGAWTARCSNDVEGDPRYGCIKMLEFTAIATVEAKQRMDNATRERLFDDARARDAAESDRPDANADEILLSAERDDKLRVTLETSVFEFAAYDELGVAPAE